ncbi:MarR family winged helix-turn-helix transcriptional regulator [Saccharospirillum alexandrii]|uniref:MarR family winged helix-turn-helix transcriptional regulator n=1 Tax=Saccharospirillum alexandrii TaxID=2448477 RepID=UPI000FDC017E|nr:MarR family winged helix-turn-helix transcriptional regulator [Saccharospirillum alexandrii]
MSTELLEQLIERISGVLRHDTRAQLSSEGLQPVQLEALAYLARANRYSDTPMGVSEYLGQTKGTVSQTLKVLENRGLLTKVPDAEDRRVTHLRLTNRGRDILARVRPAPVLQAAAKQLTPQTLGALHDHLTELLKLMQQANQNRSFAQCVGCKHNSGTETGEFWCNLTQEPLTTEEVQLICREFEAP